MELYNVYVMLAFSCVSYATSLIASRTDIVYNVRQSVKYLTMFVKLYKCMLFGVTVRGNSIIFADLLDLHLDVLFAL